MQREHGLLRLVVAGLLTGFALVALGCLDAETDPPLAQSSVSSDTQALFCEYACPSGSYDFYEAYCVGDTIHGCFGYRPNTPWECYEYPDDVPVYVHYDPYTDTCIEDHYYECGGGESCDMISDGGGGCYAQCGYSPPSCCDEDGTCNCQVTETIWWEPRGSTVQYTGGYQWTQDPWCWWGSGECQCEVKFEKYKFTRREPSTRCDDCDGDPQCDQTVTQTKVVDGWESDVFVYIAPCTYESECSFLCWEAAGASTVASWFKLGSVANLTVTTVTKFLDFCGL